MRKLLIALAAVAAVGIAVPASTGTAEAGYKVVVKHDRGHHRGWYKHKRHHGWDRGRGHNHYGYHRGHHRYRGIDRPM